jgi:hypothetical protein
MLTLKTLAVLGSLISTSYAQNIALRTPPANSTVSAGKVITVEVDKPVRLRWPTVFRQLTQLYPA